MASPLSLSALWTSRSAALIIDIGGTDTVFRAAAILAGGLVLAAGAARGQSGGAEQEPRYDPAATINLIATVNEVRDAVKPPLRGIHIVVKPSGDAIDCYLGPGDYLKDFEIAFAKGDRVQIAGSKIKFGSGEIVLVREVRKGETTVYLRDLSGTPYWAAADKGKS